MESLTHFTESLKNLELNIFIINTNLEPLIINQYVPKSIESLISNPEINKYIENITTDLEILNTLLSPISKETKKATKSKNFPKTEPYASFIIDDEPIIKEGHYQQQSFEDILANSDKETKPIKRRVPFEYKGDCIHCGAPNDYLYKHTKTQNKCIICEGTFTIQPHYHEEITHHCPHCESKLEFHHERADYDVLKCHNDSCSFYLKNKLALKTNKADHLKTSTNSYKLRYHFRLFNFNMKDIKEKLPFTINTKIDLDKIHHSKYTVGLALTYYVNYGLSSRKTSKILYEVHGIKLSHQTVINYAEAAASITENLNKSYNYDLSNTLTFDETYIKVKGKSNYVFFGSDTTKKIITSYRIFDHRTTRNAITTLYESINKFQEVPSDLNIISDGNPIYNAAQVFFKMNDIHFDLYQVIGIKNNDAVSRKYRHYKQAEERLNRTYKQNYYGTNGYGSLRNANVYMSLYVTFFNFLRTHSSLNYKTPIQLDCLRNDELMPNKWIRLLSYTNDMFLHSVYQLES